MTEVILSNSLIIKNLLPNDQHFLTSVFTFNNPIYFKLKNLKKKIGNIERLRFIKTYSIKNGNILLPRGTLEFIEKF